MPSLITDAMRAAVGSSLGRLVSFPIAESDIRRWVIAVYHPEDPPAQFWDAEVAATTRWGGIVAPLEFNPFAWMPAEPAGPVRADGALDPDRTERQLGVVGPGLRNQLNGGQSERYGERMRPGDVIRSVTRLGEYTEREGRLGAMLFTPLETTWTNQRDEIVKTAVFTLIRY